MKTLFFLFFFTVTLSAFALELPKGMSLGADGTLSIGSAKLSVAFADSNWKWVRSKDFIDRKIESDQESLRFSAAFFFGDTKGVLRQTLRQNGENRWRFEAEVEFEEPASTKTACVRLILPAPFGTLAVDGKEIVIPETEDKLILRSRRPTQTVAVELWGGIRMTMSGDQEVLVQDARRWGTNLLLQNFFSPGMGSIQRAKIAFDLDFSDAAPQPVSLAKAANRTFADKDGSGWTGQGATTTSGS